jgi:large repetitive protein
MGRNVTLVLVLSIGSAMLGLPSSSFGIDMGPAEFIKANGVDIQVPGYSVPSFEDWNADGLKDLIVGEGGGGYIGKVRVYLNNGTATEPNFQGFFYAQSNGADLTCTPTGCMGCFPRLVDWNKDGSKDLVVGQADGTVKIFPNIRGPNELPVFAAGENVTVGTSPVEDLDVGDRATPTMVDWNNDGLLDLVSGGLDGRMHIYLNCGCGRGSPAFNYSSKTGIFAQENGKDLLLSAQRTSPAIMDFDGDGKKDIITGCTDGLLLFYKNIGTDAEPSFSDFSFVTSAGVPVQLPPNSSGTGLRTRPFPCYWTGVKDGYRDLLVGYGDGKVRLYRGLPKAGDLDLDGDIDGDDFTILAKALDQAVPAGGSAADLNHDGVVDALDLRVFADLWLAEHNK